MRSTSAAKTSDYYKKVLTFYIEVVAVADGGLEQDTDGVGELLHALVIEGVDIVDGEGLIFNLKLLLAGIEGVGSLFHSEMIEDIK